MFDDVCPFYMSIGMSYDEFWNDAPIKAVFYIKAHRDRLEQQNQLAWLQGLYFHNAVSVSLANAFSKQKVKYIKEPLKIFPPDEKEKEAEAERIRQKLVERLNAFKDEFERKNRGQDGRHNT